MITVAIPVKNGGALLDEVLSAVKAQQLPDGEQLELLICDSGSTDGSQDVARRHGATLIEIAPHAFGHGRTRNLLAEHARGTHIAFLTQDATPARDDWLVTLRAAFDASEGVALSFGPYIPRPGASPMVARELITWFDGFAAPGGAPRIDRASGNEPLLGPTGFFTDANGMISRAAWERVPFRNIAYAEDHALAHDMLSAGYAKVYEPRAGVLHSHDYTLAGWYRRSYEEARALRELYGHVEPLDPRRTPLKLWGLVGADWRWAKAHGGPRSPLLLARSTCHHAARILGASVGSRTRSRYSRARV